jgi:glycosyltransferase involved in cell wall biosynthesis
MLEFAERSPYRPYYNWTIMPTVDSDPQQEQFISTYLNADGVFTYSEYGKDTIEKASHGHINVLGIASPGADCDILQPVSNKREHRQQAGFLDDITIIGTVMRNQRRKLYPNLIASFRKMLDNNKDIQDKAFLYLHTSYPDLGWDIPSLIREHDMGNHILMTYICQECHHFFPSFFQDAKMACPRCGRPTAVLSNAQAGVTTEGLSSILNWFDLYVQYSICEGFGMPQVEAGACGIPLLTVDYSAMQSVGKNLKASLIDVPQFMWDAPTHSRRAVPDDNDLINKMLSFIKSAKGVKEKKGMDAYMGVKKYYTWERTAKIWENYLDGIEPRPLSETWDSGPKIYQPNTNVPKGLSNEEFVRWIIVNTWREPEKMNSYTALRLLRDLNYGRSIGHTGGVFYNESSHLAQQLKYEPFSHQNAIEKMKEMCEKRNYWEKRRVGIDSPPMPTFVAAAKPDRKEIAKTMEKAS